MLHLRTFLCMVTLVLLVGALRQVDAHEIRPTIVTAEFSETGLYTIQINANLEARRPSERTCRPLMSFLQPHHSDFSSSPQRRAASQASASHNLARWKEGTTHGGRSLWGVWRAGRRSQSRQGSQVMGLAAPCQPTFFQINSRKLSL